ncbi:MAG: aspartate aminotransferase family protein [Anaerolineae bacterium]|jgi:glutamate-1-semialdehyde 2,1-aminomutase
MYDTGKLLSEYTAAYRERFSRSAEAHARASEVLVDGVSHGARLFAPFPFRVAANHGATIDTLDGHELVDYWQGHYANVLGHNAAAIREPMIALLQAGEGLQTGHLEERQTRYAETLARATGAERVRLTTSGTLATMYAMMLSRAYTGRSVVVKVGGGWHGANPLALKGVARTASGFDRVDSAGVNGGADHNTLVTRFNDPQALSDLFAAHGDEIACFICEPCPGNGGFVPATGEYMRAARELTARYGALLILDEVITGFRFCAGGAQRLYGVKPDLSTFGKVIGGGMPVAAVVGRADVMALCSEAAEPRVWFSGGTYSAHPLSLAAGQAALDHLLAHQDEIYPSLAAKGEMLRARIERVFSDRGVLARCSGWGNDAFPGGSLTSVYFPLRDDLVATCADDLTDPARCDHALREQVLKLAMLVNGVNVVHGLGAVSLAHSAAHLERTLEAFDAFAQRLAAAR